MVSSLSAILLRMKGNGCVFVHARFICGTIKDSKLYLCHISAAGFFPSRSSEKIKLAFPVSRQTAFPALCTYIRFFFKHVY